MKKKAKMGYLTPQEEGVRDIENLIANVCFCVSRGLIIGTLFHTVWWAGFGKTPYWWFTSIISILAGLKDFNSLWEEGVGILNVPENWIYTTIPPDAEKGPDGKFTKIIQYSAGYHKKRFRERNGPKISLGKDMEVSFELTVSATDDDIFFKGRLFLRADSKNIIQFIRTGNTEEERESNVTKAFKGVIKNYIEIICSVENSEDIVRGETRTDIIKKINKLWKDGSEEYEEEFGVQIGKLIISDIDFSPEVSENRRLAKSAERTLDAVKKFVGDDKEYLEKEFQGLGVKAIMGHLRTQANESKGSELTIHGLEDSEAEVRIEVKVP